VSNACTGCNAAGATGCSPRTDGNTACAATGTFAGQCVRCTSNAQCSGKTPICETATDTCRACAADSECSAIGPGVCGLDGSCPGDSSVIYLQNSASCSLTNKGNGTAATPYCYADDAANALSATKSVIVVHGTVGPLNPLVITLLTPHVLVAGKSTATILPPPGGAPPVIAITAGEVTLRDLTISNGNDAGVSVSDAILHMDRCYVENNSSSGIIVKNSAFDIVNTVIAGNGTGDGSYGVSLGIYNGSPTTFAFNTVVNNGFGGVACVQAYTLTGILANNGGSNFSQLCVIDGTTSTSTTPNLTTPAPTTPGYHLTATSPCVDHGGATCPPDDIDGDTRPMGACDCGADQYKP
jgi:Right handed beta helix region